MVWIYFLIGLIIGIAISILFLYLSNLNLRNQKFLQYRLKKEKAELEEYRKELLNNFTLGANFLDKMVCEYRQLHQHIFKRYGNLLSETKTENNLLRNRFSELELNNENLPIEIPRDYSDNGSNSLSENIVK